MNEGVVADGGRTEAPVPASIAAARTPTIGVSHGVSKGGQS